MVVSVTPEMVKNVVIGTTLTDPQIEGCIATATMIVVENLEGQGVSDNVLTEITLYLSAHYLSLRDKATRITEERIGDAEVKYSKSNQYKGYTPLDTTEWGATALMLDPTGSLNSLGKKQPRLINIGE